MLTYLFTQKRCGSGFEMSLFLATMGFLVAQEPTAKIEDLPRSPHLAMHHLMSQFEIKPGFTLELVASEPLVVDPVAMCFDEYGDAFVVEMIGYSERRHERLGQIRRLSDTDGDGVMDASVIYADSLAWPTAVACYSGGVFVGTTPDILYLKDLDGDGVADLTQKVFTGFAASSAPFGQRQLNMQAMLNSFHWGPDNRIHGATGLSGGRIVSPLRPDMEEVSLRGRDFSFDPETLDFRSEGGGAQHGMSFDADWNKFVCSNSDHIQSVVYDPFLAGSNPVVRALPSRLSIARDGPAAPVFRISPDEPWRVMRTRWRVAGAVSGPVEGGGTPSGYFTGATGVTLFTGDAWGEDYRGDAWIADCGSNLIHHKRLHQEGPIFSAFRPEDESETEFIRSSEHWFRPVQFANAPDGNLYVLDMHREVIEHPWSLPEGIKQHLDLNQGNDRGRIYRIRRKHTPLRTHRALSRSAEEDATLWMAWLGHANGWHRQTALRLLYENPRLELEAKLRQLTQEGKQSHLRMDAWQVLMGWNRLSPSDWITLLNDADPRVQVYGLKRLFHWKGSLPGSAWESTAQALIQNDRTRFECLLALAPHELPPSSQAALLWRGMLEESSNQRWIEFAALNAATRAMGPLMEGALKDGGGGLQGLQDPGALFFVLGAQGDRTSVGKVASTLFTMSPSSETWVWLLRLNEGMTQAGIAWEDVMLPELKTQRWQQLQQRLARLEGESYREIVSLLSLVATGLKEELRTAWMPWFWETRWSEFRKPLLKAMAPHLKQSDWKDMLQRWDELGPAIRQSILGHLMEVPSGTEWLLRRIEQMPLLGRELSYTQRQRLVGHRNPSTQAKAKALLEVPTSSTDDASIHRFKKALLMEANTRHGEEVFEQRCASCHRANGKGHAVGPDMVSVKTSGKTRILDSVLYPNREVQPQFMSYEIIPKGEEEGRVGLVANETASTIELLQAGGLTRLFAKDKVSRMDPTGISLMPEGLLADLSVQQVADLLEFLVRVRE
ncbi:MAG TPA: hypothetical protein DEP78_10870 [Verrucomicrobiales bacterium]|nr:hypothetical protein [Verrucomicrobiales bacterium]